MTLLPQQPIGIFDSGIGGLTVAHKVIEDFSQEQIIYFGDTAHLPYGDKSDELIQHYALNISKFLIEKKCKLIVIACNTASSVAYDLLRQELGDQTIFVNVVDPAIKGILAINEDNKVGVIGTKGTISSDIYANKLRNANPVMQISSLATPLLAPMIEAGFFNSQISEQIIHTYLQDEQLADIKSLILACTHYPLIKKQISGFYGNKVNVIDSTDFISTEIRKILTENNLLNVTGTQGDNHFYVSDYTESFEKTTKVFFTEKINLEYCPLWDA